MTKYSTDALPFDASTDRKQKVNADSPIVSRVFAAAVLFSDEAAIKRPFSCNCPDSSPESDAAFTALLRVKFVSLFLMGSGKQPNGR